MKNGFFRFALALITCISFSIIPALPSAPTNGTPAKTKLSGLIAFSVDDAGNPAGNFVWDTRGVGSDYYKVYLAGGTPGGSPDGLTNGFINGPDWSSTPLNITLEEGTHAFTIFFQHNGDWPAFGLNLFFEDSSIAQICAKGSARTGDVIPPFSANSAPVTYSMSGFPNAPASGRTRVAVGEVVIELIAYYVAARNVFNVDRVDTHSATSNGRIDYVGTFTLSVEKRSPTAPSILTPPQSQTVEAGGTATFGVVADGTAPLLYQWLKDDAEIAGATAALLRLTNVLASDAGEYSVRVSNDAGSVTSESATLALAPPRPPSILAHPVDQTVEAGGTATFRVVADGTAPLSYQWLKDGAEISGATTAQLTLNNVLASDAGEYSARVSNEAGSVTSAAATLTLVPPGTPRLTGVFAFSSDNRGNPAGNFVWDTRGLESDFYKVWLTGGTPAGDSDGLINPFINGPDWSSAPIDIALEEGTHAFTIFFQHNGDWPAFGLNLFFQHSRVAQICAQGSARTGDEIPPFGANSAPVTYSMTSFPTPDAPASGRTRVALGDVVVELTAYYVAATRVFNVDRVDTHDATSNRRIDYVGTFTLSVEKGPPTAPSILTPPESQTVEAGRTATFRVIAEGSEPLSYQWLKDAAEISGATAAQLTLNNVLTSDAGEYSVRVSNDIGSVTSAAATLTVTPPVPLGTPRILAHPESQSVEAGGTATFRVVARGTAPLLYQWLKGGEEISGATAAQLTLNNVMASDAGEYSVRVSNDVGSVTSEPATLTVIPAGIPRLTAVFALSSDNEGNPAGDFVWDTRGLESDFYKVWLTRGTPAGDSDGLTNPFMNGPDWSSAPINIPLAVGTHDFTIFFQHNGQWPTFGLNLFFQDSRVAQICAKASARTGDEIPPFTANSAPVTYSMTSFPGPNVPASGRTQVTVGAVVVELTAYYVAATNVFSADRVDTHAATSNDRIDYVGTFTLTVTPRLSTNNPPVARVELLPNVPLLPGQPHPFLIACNGESALVTLDGRGSFDPDNDAITYAWFARGASEPFSTADVISNAVPIGMHTVTLRVSDGADSSEAIITYEVISPGQAVAAIDVLLDSESVSSKILRPLKTALELAMRAAVNGDLRGTIEQLTAFQGKVESQLTPTHPALALALIDAAQTVIDNLDCSGGN